MKNNFTYMLLVFSLLFYSCETLGINLGEIFPPSQSNPSGGSQSGTLLSPARDDPNRRGDPDSANWDISILDTAADVDYLTGVEKDVILEMNKVRTDPK